MEFEEEVSYKEQMKKKQFKTCENIENYIISEIKKEMLLDYTVIFYIPDDVYHESMKQDPQQFSAEMIDMFVPYDTFMAVFVPINPDFIHESGGVTLVNRRGWKD